MQSLRELAPRLVSSTPLTAALRQQYLLPSTRYQHLVVALGRQFVSLHTASGIQKCPHTEDSDGWRRHLHSTAEAQLEQLHAPLPTLTHGQAVRVKKLLKQRAQQQADIYRSGALLRFKRAVRTGKFDSKLPIKSWLAHIMNRQLETPENQPMASLPGFIFNRPVNQYLLYQVVRWQRAKRRKPIACTKTRAEVRGGGRKPHKQKGSGMARQGTIRAPHMRGGGVVFGPKPRSFAFKLPKHTRKAGLMAALSSKAQAGQLVIVDTLLLPDADARVALRELLKSLLPSLKAIDKTHPDTRGSRLFRSQLYNLVDNDPSLFGTPKEGTHELKALHADELILDNMMARMEAKKEDFSAVLAKTGWFLKHFTKLLPPGWDHLKPRLQTANELLERLNTGFSPDRMERLKRDRRPKQRVSALIVDSDDGTEDGGVLLRSTIANLPAVNALPVRGLNVYDILKHEYLIMTTPGLHGVIERLSRPVLRGFKPRGFDWKKHVQQEKARRVEERKRRSEIEAWLQERGIPVRNEAGSTEAAAS